MISTTPGIQREKALSLEQIADINVESLGRDTAASFRFRYIDISSVSTGKIDWSTVTTQTFANAPSRARRVVRPNDILLSTVRPGLQSHAYASWKEPEGYVCSTGFAVIRPRCETSPRYLFHLLFSDVISTQLRQLETGSSYPAVNERDVRQLRVPVVPPSGQRRIAEMLDTVDETIQKTEELIAKLKQVKAGLLHDLLTRGIDEHGRLRDPVAHPEQFKDSPSVGFRGSGRSQMFPTFATWVEVGSSARLRSLATQAFIQCIRRKAEMMGFSAT